MQGYFNLVKVDMNDLFTVSANLGHLTIKINGIATHRTARNDNSNHLRFLLHLEISFLEMAKYDKNKGY